MKNSIIYTDTSLAMAVMLGILFLMSKIYDFRMYFMYPLSILLPANINIYTSNSLSQKSSDELLTNNLTWLSLLGAICIIFSLNIGFGLLEALLFKFLLNWSSMECCITIFLLNVALHSISVYQSMLHCEAWKLSTLMDNFADGLFCAFERTTTHILGILIYYLLF